MIDKKIIAFNFIPLIIILLTVVLSFFPCFEITTVNSTAVNGTYLESIKHDKQAANFMLFLLLGFIQGLLLCIGGKKSRIFGLICAFLMLIEIPAEFIKRNLEQTINQGGLGSASTDIKPLGYIIIALSIVNVIICIFSFENKKTEV